MFFIPDPKKQISPSPSKKDYNQNQKPPLIPYYQKVLPQTLKGQPLPIKPTQIPESSPCYMFDQASPSYSQNFPPLESFDHPQTNTKHVWKIRNPVAKPTPNFLRPENSPSPPPPIFPPPPLIPDYQTRLAYSPTTD